LFTAFEITQTRLLADFATERVECEHVIAPLLAKLANASFVSGTFPSSRYKSGLVIPLLKKPGLNKVDPANYRPITFRKTCISSLAATSYSVQ
jgi:hypothetical protein